MPVRGYIRAVGGGEFISRPRVVAIRELAPSNIVYYEGSKFKINKTSIPVKGIEYDRVALCHKCGYFHDGENFDRDTCQNCLQKLASDSAGNSHTLTQVLPMETAFTRRRERITCDEEERLKYGYDIITHFRYDEERKEAASVTTSDGTEILKLTYGETASIWRINRGLKRSRDRGFKLNTETGEWGDSKDFKNTSTENNIQTGVNLMVSDTCNLMVVEVVDLPESDKEGFLVTLQYALEKAIQALYKLEPNELKSILVGKEKYILFWEAAEGGAGVLSNILSDPKAISKLADAAQDICHFKQPKVSCTQACYECLLSYQNQSDHPRLNRHLISSFLNQLTNSTLSRHCQGVSRAEQYQQLRARTDPNSDFERVVLEEIYKRGIKLPDSAQELIPEANSLPDFLYKKAKIAVFCDGSVHDSPARQEKDRIQRENLQWNVGYTPLVLRYDEDWKSKLDLLKALI